MKYLYLNASLPDLEWKASPPFSMESFLGYCTEMLTPDDRREQADLLAENMDACQSAFAEAWFDRETQVRNAVAGVRARRQSVGAEAFFQYHPGFHVYLQEGVIDAFATSNALETEEKLDGLRWWILNELARENPFGLDGVLAYTLKLQMLHRWHPIKADRGRERLQNHLETIVGNARGEQAP